jgi:transposase
MRFVPIKTVEQQVMQAEHRIRARLIRSRTALSNEIRGLLAELGIVVSTSLGRLRRAVPEILEDGENGLPGSFRHLLAQLGGELREIDDNIKAYDARITQAAREDHRIKRLLAIEDRCHIEDRCQVQHSNSAVVLKIGVRSNIPTVR